MLQSWTDARHKAFTPKPNPMETSPFIFYRTPPTPLFLRGARGSRMLGQLWVLVVGWEVGHQALSPSLPPNLT